MTGLRGLILALSIGTAVLAVAALMSIASGPACAAAAGEDRRAGGMRARPRQAVKPRHSNRRGATRRSTVRRQPHATADQPARATRGEPDDLRPGARGPDFDSVFAMAIAATPDATPIRPTAIATISITPELYAAALGPLEPQRAGEAGGDVVRAAPPASLAPALTVLGALSLAGALLDVVWLVRHKTREACHA